MLFVFDGFTAYGFKQLNNNSLLVNPLVLHTSVPSGEPCNQSALL